MNKLKLIPQLDACQFPGNVVEEFEDNDINTHYQADDVYLQWEDEDDMPMLKAWLLETYGDVVQDYKTFAVSPT